MEEANWCIILIFSHRVPILSPKFHLKKEKKKAPQHTQYKQSLTTPIKNNIDLGGGGNQHPLAKDISSTDEHLTKISGNSKEANTTSSAKEPDGTAGKIISTDWQLDPMITAQGRRKRKTRGISVWWSKSIITSSLWHFYIILIPHSKYCSNEWEHWKIPAIGDRLKKVCHLLKKQYILKCTSIDCITQSLFPNEICRYVVVSKNHFILQVLFLT